MKITRIAARAFIGLDALDIGIHEHVVLFSGGNACGKSSVADALLFALDMGLPRIDRKNQVKDLIRDGAKLGYAAVTVANNTDAPIEYKRSAATGHQTGAKPPDYPSALYYALDPAAFLRLAPNDRIEFLFRLMGVQITAQEIVKRLEARGHPSGLVDSIRHLLPQFERACTETQGAARELKGSWRQLTGEPYGEVKADSWTAWGPDVDCSDLEGLRKDFATVERGIADAQRRLGAAEEREAERERLEKIAVSDECPEGVDIEAKRAGLAKVESSIEALHRMLGEARTRKKDRARQAGRLEELSADSGLLEARQSEEESCRQILDARVAEEREVRQALVEARASVTVESRVTQGIFFHCPKCKEPLVCDYRREHKMGKPTEQKPSQMMDAAQAEVSKLAAAVAEAENRRCMAENSMHAAPEALAKSRVARGTLASFLDEAVGEDVSTAELEAKIETSTKVRTELRALIERCEKHEIASMARARLEELRASESAAELRSALHTLSADREALREKLAVMQNAAREQAEAKNRTARAAVLQGQIRALIALAADLAPDGVPAELLAEALGPINERLAMSAEMTGWPRVSIDPEGIQLAGRGLRLASQSELWRGRAMIAEAIAKLSGLGCFFLDGMDIIEPAKRPTLIVWLLEIAKEHETILVTATLKQPPTTLPKGIQSVWLGAAATHHG